jgi:hypothetical protein
MTQIEKNVPVPMTVKETLLLMTVGDSALFPLESRPNVAGTASRLKKETGKEFIVRKVDNNLRVWRTK